MLIWVGRGAMMLMVLSAILLVVAYNMGEWREIPKLLKMSWATVVVWLIGLARHRP